MLDDENKQELKSYFEALKYYFLSPRFRIIILDIIGVILILLFIYLILSGKFDFYSLFSFVTN